jgi:uncharacterized cupin superfamily protein
MRPPFIVSAASLEETSSCYPHSDELMAPTRRIGRKAGLRRMGINLVRVPPGYRTSWPHAESAEEEFVYVLRGSIDAWIDGELHRMTEGDLAAFPAGTGVCHTFLNNGEHDAELMVGGESDRCDNRIYYPLHPGRRDDMPWSHWWDDIPLRPQGPHDGLPDKQRK